MMKCEQYHDLFAGWLDDQLDAGQQAVLEKHLGGCWECHEELATMQLFWDQLGQIEAPEPSGDLDAALATMLHDYKRSVPEPPKSWTRLWQAQPRWPLAYSLVPFVLLLSIGLLLYKNKDEGQEKQLAALSTQVHELKQTMALALLENPSAAERMRAVSYTSELKHTDTKVIQALLTTLNNDPNVNVRLRTLDALATLAAQPEVREGLVSAILQQDSPILQSAIAVVMQRLQEKSAVRSFKKLLEQKDLDPAVREKITETITKLI